MSREDCRTEYRFYTVATIRRVFELSTCSWAPMRTMSGIETPRVAMHGGLGMVSVYTPSSGHEVNVSIRRASHLSKSERSGARPMRVRHTANKRNGSE